MWFRLVFYIMLYTGLLGAGSWVIYRTSERLVGMLGGRRRQHQLKGKKNQLLLEEHREETCRLCLEPIDPEKDPYDKKLGWYHISCYQSLLNDRR